MENPISLTLQDLGAVCTIIDTACTRGAFKADEMQLIGELYNKLNTFVTNSIQVQQAAAEAAQAEQSQSPVPVEQPQGDA
jgi:hypothetical protein